eukprot:363689-Chlamydomonas_euryale.AAC.8
MGMCGSQLVTTSGRDSSTALTDASAAWTEPACALSPTARDRSSQTTHGGQRLMGPGDGFMAYADRPRPHMGGRG